MYNDRIYLTPQEILEKEFKIDTRGYRPQEVDKFLDLIIRDYTEYNTILKLQDKTIKELREDNLKLQGEVRRLRELLENASETSSQTVSNVDLLKRLSQLEKVVFGRDE